MEIKARYVLIGLFVVAVIVGGFGFVYWLNNSGSLGPRTTYRVSFAGSVAGLLDGSEVLFNGINVGEVTQLALVADDPTKVVATIAIDQRTPVRGDTHVGLIFSGLTGVATVALTGGSPDVDVPAASDGGSPILVADPEDMRDVTQAARDVLGRIDALISDNSAAFKSAIANIDTFASALAANSDKVTGILEGLERLTGGKTEAPPNVYDLAAPTEFTGLGAVPAAQLVIEQPTALLTIDTQRINVKSPKGEAPAFPDARWADNVPLLVQARIIQSFENAKFLKVGTDSSGMNGDYRITLAVQTFRVDTVASPAVAEVTLSAKLLDADGNVVDAKVFATTAPTPDTATAAGASQGINAAFGRAAAEIVTWTVAAIDAKAAADAPAPDAASDMAAPDAPVPAAP